MEEQPSSVPVPFVVADALRQDADRLRSDLHTVSEWAKLLRKCGKTTLKFLRQLEADGLAWRSGASWQVALIAAPASYLKELGLVARAVSDEGLDALADAIGLGKIGKNRESC
jgi:hypothetical protein